MAKKKQVKKKKKKIEKQDEVVENPTFEDLERIVETKSMLRFKWETDEEGVEPLPVDMQTANVIVTVAGNLGEANFAFMQGEITKGRLAFTSLVAFCWGAMK